MTRSILFCIFALAACGDNLTPDPPTDAGPNAPVPPAADGEYAISIAQDSFMCADGEEGNIPTHYEVTDVIPQNDPWKFDLLSRPAHVLQQWDDYYRYDLTWDNTGFFENNRFDPVWLGGEVDRFITGSVNDSSLYFFHRFDIGYHTDDGTWNSVCVYAADVNGSRRYAPWDGKPRNSIDGQWRVKKTVLDSPLHYSTPLPYMHFVTMDTTPQTDDGSLFYISGTYKDQPLYIFRDPATGTVDAYALQIIPVPLESQTWMMETKLQGTLLPDKMDLEFSWKWTVMETGEVEWYQHELYQGVPRYQPHNPNLTEPPTGVYKATYKMLPSDCPNTVPYTENRLLDILPADDGILLNVTDAEREPVTRVDTDNSVSFTFNRHLESGTTYTYWIDGAVDGHNLNLIMDITVLDADGNYQCAVTYQITGQKRYESYR